MNLTSSKDKSFPTSVNNSLTISVLNPIVTASLLSSTQLSTISQIHSYSDLEISLVYSQLHFNIFESSINIPL